MEKKDNSTDIKKIESKKLMEMYMKIGDFVKYLEKEENKTTEE